MARPLREALAPYAGHARRRPWVASGLAVALLCTILLLFVDRPVARLFRPWWEQPAGLRFEAWSDIGLGILWYIIAVVGWLGFRFAAFLSAHGDVAALNRRRSRSFRFMTWALVLSGVANAVLKLAFGRPRPKFLEDGLYGFHPFSTFGSNSFPSGHSQTIATAVFCLWTIFPRFGWAIAALAASIALARVPAFAHYPSDVLAGLWVGALIAWAVRTRFEADGGPLSLLGPARQPAR
jgi:membrane-associated phospholipid phosphatase